MYWMSYQGGPGCAGQFRRSISLHPSRKWWTFPHHRNFPHQNVQTFGYVHDDTSGQHLGPTSKTQLFLLNELCMVTHLQDYRGKGNLKKKVLLGHGWENVPDWECQFAHRKQGLFQPESVDDIKKWLAEGKTSVQM